MNIKRRQFIQGIVGGVAALGFAFPGMRYLEAATSGSEAQVGEKIWRTGHSNNCDGACGHLVHTVGNRATFIESAPWEGNINGEKVQDFQPRICLRGLSQIQNTYSPNRIKYPYKRVGPRGSGQWQRISWEEATSAIAENFKKVQAKYGKESVWIAPYTGSLSVLEGVIGAGYRFASVIGASAGDFEGDNEGDSSCPAGFNYVLADPTDPANGGGIFDGHEYTDFINSRVIFLWANNLAETSIPDWRTICDARKNGTKLVVIDPRFTPTSAAADLWVPIRPGTDTALIDAMINWIIQNKRYDEDYLRQFTVAPYLIHPQTKKFLKHKDVVPGGEDKYMVMDVGDGKIKKFDDPSLSKASLLGTYSINDLQVRTSFQVLADTMTKYTPEYTSKITDVASETIIALAELYAGNHPAGIKAGFGLSHWHRGDLTFQALLTMSALTGNIGVHGGGVTIFSGALLTTAYDVSGWFFPDNKQYTYLPPMEASDAMLEGKPYPVRAAWFVIDNFAQQMSDRNKVLKALNSLDFLVVSDYVLSATAELADIVLPACTYLEKTDLLGSGNYYLQYMPKIVNPLWESKSDLDAFTMVAKKMGVGQYFSKQPDDYIKDILHIGDPNAADPVKGLDWKQLTQGAHRVNVPAPYVPFADKKFPTKSGKIEFYVELLLPYDQEICDYKEPVEASPNNPLYQKYPLVFLSTHTRFRTHSQYSDLPWLKEANNNGEGFLEINPIDAAQRGISNGEIVRIFNDRGSMKVRARLTEGIKPGVTNCYQGGWATKQVKHYIEGHPNNLTHQIANPAQSIVPNFRSNAAYYDCLVQVEKVKG
ncbi:molybdopterin-dependent oxidoreductase [Desulfosporosinus sp. FKA]|uniref:molybdopterin-containing oxidoreductase family protein n=1 Tax=Desulfosporosinus sp. FKA TaxID=1969834 RepID=UPI000B49E6DE|nr:molybdopterin-dependent oxidoreductase [Desulfosporosinus sp. FKA]